MRLTSASIHFSFVVFAAFKASPMQVQAFSKSPSVVWARALYEPRLVMHSIPRQNKLRPHDEPFRGFLHSELVRWAAAEGVSEARHRGYVAAS